MEVLIEFDLQKLAAERVLWGYTPVVQNSYQTGCLSN